MKVETSEKGSAKQRKLMSMGVNYLCVRKLHPRPTKLMIVLTGGSYRYGMLIVFANYLIEMRESTNAGDVTFEEWMEEHREIANLLHRRSLD